MHADATTIANRPASVRSRVTNGTRLHERVDGRSATARRFRDLVAAFTAEIGATLTEAERGAVRQAATLTLRAEQLQAAVVRGDAVNGDELIRLAGEARRLMQSLRRRAPAKSAAAASGLAAYLAKKEATT